MGPISYSRVPIAEVTAARPGQFSFEEYLNKRIIRGYLFVWGLRDYHGTKFVKGCCAKSIRERGPGSNAKYKMTFLWQHNQSDPLSLFDVLEEDDYGLYFETKALDDVENGNRTITQIRSGTLNQFSGGFDYVYDKMEYDETDDSIVCLEIELMEGSVVTIASQKETFAIRTVENISQLDEQTEEFIGILPHKNRLQARNLFTRYKSLLHLEEETLDNQEPPNHETRKIKFDYLIKNL